MDIEAVKIIVSSLKAGGKVYNRGVTLHAPLPPAIILELRAQLAGKKGRDVEPTLEILKRKDAGPIENAVTAQDAAEAEVKAKAEAKAKADAEQERIDKMKSNRVLELEAQAKLEAEAVEKAKEELQLKAAARGLTEPTENAKSELDEHGVDVDSETQTETEVVETDNTEPEKEVGTEPEKEAVKDPAEAKDETVAKMTTTKAKPPVRKSATAKKSTGK